MPTCSRIVPVVSFLLSSDLSHVGGGERAADDLDEDDEDVEQPEDQQLRLQLALVHDPQDLEAALREDDVANGVAFLQLLAAARPVLRDVVDSAALARFRQLGAAAVRHAKLVSTISWVTLK